MPIHLASSRFRVCIDGRGRWLLACFENRYSRVAKASRAKAPISEWYFEGVNILRSFAFRVGSNMSCLAGDSPARGSYSILPRCWYLNLSRISGLTVLIDSVSSCDAPELLLSTSQSYCIRRYAKAILTTLLAKNLPKPHLSVNLDRGSAVHTRTRMRTISKPKVFRAG